MTQTAKFETAAHQLLEELDLRHDQLLEELDRLNARVDEVLAQFAPPRPADAPTAVAIEISDESEDSEFDDE